MESTFNHVKFSDSDIVNPEDFIPRGDFNPHSMRPFLLHDHGFVICVVFAEHLQDALDRAVDADKLDRFQVDENDLKECRDNGNDPMEVYTPLGNASELFDIEGLDCFELPVPEFSFCALLNNYLGDLQQKERVFDQGGFVAYDVKTGRVYATGERINECRERLKKQLAAMPRGGVIPISYLSVSPSTLSVFEQLISLRDREDEE